MEILESVVKKSPAFHTLTFNLATVYELCGDRAPEMKKSLIHHVLHSDQSSGEMIPADFKL